MKKVNIDHKDMIRDAAKVISKSNEDTKILLASLQIYFK